MSQNSQKLITETLHIITARLNTHLNKLEKTILEISNKIDIIDKRIEKLEKNA
ncbi:MAG: hypothetical protein ACXAC7_05375 [Candidatus Hodarchaeales archaeon]|jgi:hypothetical protein